MNATQEVETVMANLLHLKGSSNEFGKISVTEDYTEIIKRYVGEAKEKTVEDPNYIYKIRGTPKNGLRLAKFARKWTKRNVQKMIEV